MTFKNDEAVLEFKNLYQIQEEDDNRINILLYSFILNVAEECEKEPNLTFEKFAEIGQGVRVVGRLAGSDGKIILICEHLEWKFSPKKKTENK